MGAAVIVLIVVVVIVVALVAFGVSGFNKLRKSDIAAQEALGGIDVQLQRRADLIPNLVNTVKGYAAHEAGVFEAVTAARARVAQAAKGNDVPEKAAADQQLSNALVNVMAVAEAYPDLKASANFADLQKQLADTENQISFARQYYNDAVTQLNNAVSTIPTMFFAGVAGVSKREFYKAPEGVEAAPQVSFDPPAPQVGTTPAAPPAVEQPPAAPQVGSPQAEPPASGGTPPTQ
ncbi:LemA family protein [Nocardioides mangrovicus]|uniref:LemA family protein n=1 Tax=Nocardioides mangrovicus TaxID=2478913 RepID=A0A3L8P4Y6_9ACTN|nr:LemA family protein [Nocardioides mangrovicus]RLV50067.1 LemA family protein [Nocardioides mangrovicus]